MDEKTSCWQVGLTDEVIRTELVWVRLYRDAMERLQRMAVRESQGEGNAEIRINFTSWGKGSVSHYLQGFKN